MKWDANLKCGYVVILAPRQWSARNDLVWHVKKNSSIMHVPTMLERFEFRVMPTRCPVFGAF